MILDYYYLMTYILFDLPEKGSTILKKLITPFSNPNHT